MRAGGENRRPTGAHFGLGAWALVNRRPRLANASMLGVGTRSEPRHCTVVHVIDDHEHVGPPRGMGYGDTEAQNERDQYCPATVHYRTTLKAWHRSTPFWSLQNTATTKPKKMNDQKPTTKSSN